MSRRIVPRGHLPTGAGKVICPSMPDPKVALVTGAGRGIGRDVAQRLAREGYAVGLIARTKSQLDETAALIRQAGGRALVTPTDVGKRAGMKRTLVRETISAVCETM